MSPNEIIKQFLTEWLEWVEAGAVEPHFIFRRGYGLCVSLTRYLNRTGYSNQYSEIKTIFLDMLDLDMYPFGGETKFVEESIEGTMHLNKQRIQWAIDKLKELSNG